MKKFFAALLILISTVVYGHFLLLLNEEKSDAVFLPILTFHHLRDYSSQNPKDLEYLYSFSPKKFEAFLQFFQDNGIETLTFLDLQEILKGKKSWPKKSVMLNFDDGFTDHYSVAFPLLKKYEKKATFFIISGKPSQDAGYANWEQLKEMVADGQEIAAHTVTHPNLPSLSESEIMAEISESKITIEEKLQTSVVSFAYPQGEYDNRSLETVADLFLFGRTTIPGKYFSEKKRYEIPAVIVPPTADIKLLEHWFPQS